MSDGHIPSVVRALEAIKNPGRSPSSVFRANHRMNHRTDQFLQQCGFGSGFLRPNNSVED